MSSITPEQIENLTRPPVRADNHKVLAKLAEERAKRYCGVCGYWKPVDAQLLGKCTRHAEAVFVLDGNTAAPAMTLNRFSCIDCKI